MLAENLLMDSVEYYDIAVRDANMVKAISAAMFRLRNIVFTVADRVVLKMEISSFMITKKEKVVIGGNLMNIFNTSAEKFDFTFKIGVHIKYVSTKS